MTRIDTPASKWSALYQAHWTLLALALVFLAIAAPARASTSITLGVVPQFEQRKLFATWKPIVDELSQRTGLEVKLAVTLTVQEFEQELEKGSFDFVYANPYHILKVSTSQGYIPLVRDREPLHGILVVRRDSPLRKVEELAGKTLAVPSPNALGASLLIQADLQHVFKTQMSLLNVRTHSSVYLHVLNGLADAGGGVEKTLSEQDPSVRDALRVLYTTRPMPSHPIAAHPRIARQIREKMQKALLEMGNTPSGKGLLDDVPMPYPEKTTLDDYLPMRQWGLDTYWQGSRK